MISVGQTTVSLLNLYLVQFRFHLVKALNQEGLVCLF